MFHLVSHTSTLVLTHSIWNAGIDLDSIPAFLCVAQINRYSREIDNIRPCVNIVNCPLWTIPITTLMNLIVYIRLYTKVYRYYISPYSYRNQDVLPVYAMGTKHCIAKWPMKSPLSILVNKSKKKRNRYHQHYVFMDNIKVCLTLR